LSWPRILRRLWGSLQSRVTNKSGKNAYGKCVAMKARHATEQETEARVNAAKTCKMLKAEQQATFEAAYGTKKNAFGKCVSETAKASSRDGPTLRGALVTRGPAPPQAELVRDPATSREMRALFCRWIQPVQRAEPRRGINSAARSRPGSRESA
jgi:hypothetical protein